MDGDAFENHLLAELETFFEVHAFQVQNQVYAIRLLSNLDDVRRVQEIFFCQTECSKTKITMVWSIRDAFSGEAQIQKSMSLV